MSLPGNGIFVVQGEMAMLVTAMRRSTRWGSHSFPNDEYDVLMRTFHDLKTILNQVDDLRLLDPATYLSPFLEVIRSKETTGPVTSLALSSIHKFLSYGLIDPTHPSVPATVEDIADAVTHARFVGTDHSSDGVVLLKILQVLRTLMLSPEGAMLTDESVCEIMLSCFRTCFETRLTELLRRNAEQCLRDMTQLIFMRLPQFPTEDPTSTFSTFGFSLKRRDKLTKKKITAAHSTTSLDRKSPITEQAVANADNETEPEITKPHTIIQAHNQDKNLLNEAEITIEPVEEVKTPTKKHGRHSSMDLAANENKSITQLLEKCVSNTETPEPPAEETKTEEENVEVAEDISEETEQPSESTPPTVVKEETQNENEKLEEYVNHRGIRFTPQDETFNLQPYGLACVRELFRFLISLCNPLDAQNTSAMVHLGLSLVGTALEVGADQIARYPSLLYLVQDPLCKNLLSLLDTEKITIFALDLQIWFLLFEALRVHLKYQMEAFFKKIIEIISADTTKSIYELKEIHHIALESLAQMFRIPGLCTELYLNFDCDIYCTNVFEELTKLLSKNVVASTAYNIHTVSLEVLMTIIEAIEVGTMQKVEIETGNVEEEREKEKDRDNVRGGHVFLELGGMDDASVVSDHVTHDISQYFGGGRAGRHKPPADLPTEAELDNVRNMKKWVTQGTELFNQKPEKGIEFMQEHGIFTTPIDPHQVALFLRENPDLDKKMIGEYICKRSSRGDEGGPSILGAFADSFDYTGLRLEQALRLYLETFRLPGEAPLISLVMEKFAERWHSTNGEPFANTDAAFRLAYAVIMLNVDQHNHNAKKHNVPMTVEDFVRNLRGCNGSGDFEQPMLEAIFHSIKEKEMVMPAERVGPQRDAYLWRVLQRRGRTPAAKYRLSPPPPHALHARLLPAACPPAVTALSASFERSSPPTIEEIQSSNPPDSAVNALDGLERCAALVARLSADTLTLDTLLLTLCKFTGLLTPQHASYIAIGVSLGQSVKAQLALRRACAVAARHADCVRDSWRHLLEILNTLYIGRLLPKSLVEAEDYLSPDGKVSLIREATRGDSGLLSSIYSYIALGESGIRAPTPHEKSLIDAATKCVAKCNLPGLLITETKFLQLESLQELIRAMVAVGIPPDSDSMQLNPQLEDITIFFLELLGQTLIQNRDRVETLWADVGPHIERTVFWAGGCGAHALTRALTALLRTSARLMRCEQCAPLLLNYLTLLYRLPYKLFYQQADVISSGLYELVKTSAQNVHSASEWGVLLALLAAAGAGAWPRGAPSAAYTAGSSRSEGSEDDSERQPTSVSSESELSHSPQTQGWILVKSESTSATETVELELEQVSLRPHRNTALARCVEALALVIRDVAHVTPHNCRAAVRCVRLLAKATLQSGRHSANKEDRRSGSARRRTRHDSSDEEIDTQDHYHVVSIKLLDLMHTLHSRTAQIFKWWRDEADHGQGAEDYDLWEVAWKPLLQGIAEFCTDNRGKKGSSSAIAYSAIAYLQRALLAPALAALGGAGWEACFEHVLLPLLADPPRRPDAAARADTVMCKVFLQHLPALVGRPSFASLWSRIIRVQQALLSSPAEPLREAALESLKNMLLVMHSVKIFSNAEGYNDLWYITWDIIAEFLPNLKEELFPEANNIAKPPQSVPSHMQPSIPPIAAIVPVGSNSTPNIPTSSSTTNIDTNNSPQLTNPQRSNVQSPNILLATAHSPVNMAQSPSLPGPPLITPVPVPGIQTAGIPGLITPAITGLTQLPRVIQPGLKANTDPSPISPIGKPGTAVNVSLGSAVISAPVSGMVPIRNSLYDQTGLTSSVLLQPLNEMISTPIGISIQSQPTLQPINQTHQPYEDEDNVIEIESTQEALKVQQSEIYADYITNPYNEIKDLSTKEATLYDPEENRYIAPNDQNLSERLLQQKSFSANATPMHRNKAAFGSTDNVRQEGIFNFSSYFGTNERVTAGSEVFDALMSTQEG